MTENEKPNIWELLRKRYPAGEYALLAEVSNAAGFGRSHSCDYISIGLWPSRGLEITGIELKSFRNDWLRELKKPEKAEAFFKYCDRWYLLIDDEKIAQLAEVPPTWGLLCVKGKRIVTLKEAPKLSPVPVDRSFMAALFKRATQGMIHPSQIEEKIQEAIDSHRGSLKYSLENKTNEHDALLEKVHEFEKASGVSISNRHEWDWDPSKVGKAIKYLINSKLNFEDHLRNAKKNALYTIETIDSILPELETSKPKIFNENGQPENH